MQQSQDSYNDLILNVDDGVIPRVPAQVDKLGNEARRRIISLHYRYPDEFKSVNPSVEMFMPVYNVLTNQVFLFDVSSGVKQAFAPSVSLQDASPEFFESIDGLYDNSPWLGDSQGLLAIPREEITESYFAKVQNELMDRPDSLGLLVSASEVARATGADVEVKYERTIDKFSQLLLQCLHNRATPQQAEDMREDCAKLLDAANGRHRPMALLIRQGVELISQKVDVGFSPTDEGTLLDLYRETLEARNRHIVVIGTPPAEPKPKPMPRP